MSFRARPDRKLTDELLRVLREEIDQTARAVADGRQAERKRIQRARKGTKRSRALLRLLRSQAPSVYDVENPWLRDSARKLSSLRDADALVEACDRLARSDSDATSKRALAQLKAALSRWRRESRPDTATVERELGRFVERLGESTQRLKRVTLPPGDFDALAPELQKLYRQARRAFQTAYEQPSAPAFHAWRKATKRLSYAIRFLRCAWPGEIKVFGKTLKKIGSLLGDDHDLAMLETFLRDHAAIARPSSAHLLNRLRIEVARLRGEAEPLGQRAFALKPRAFAEAMNSWWAAARRPRTRKAGPASKSDH